MSCSCCCTNTLGFCNQNVCGSGINFDIKAQVEGVHKLVTYFLGIQLIIEVFFLVDDFLVFPISDLNENFEYTVELFAPSGDKIVISKDSIQYDCFKFKTVLQKVLVAVAEESS